MNVAAVLSKACGAISISLASAYIGQSMAEVVTSVPTAVAAISAVDQAYAKVAADHRSNPPNTIGATLLWLAANDQAGRAALHSIDMTELSVSEQASARDAIWRQINMHDLADQAALKRILPRAGWFSAKQYGEKAAQGAFLVVQHASNDLALQQEILRRLGSAVDKGEVSGEEYSLLYDRVALAEGHPQRYGTQMVCVAGHWAPAPLENVANLDDLRRAMGFKDTFADYVKSFDDAPACHVK